MDVVDETLPLPIAVSRPRGPELRGAAPDPGHDPDGNPHRPNLWTGICRYCNGPYPCHTGMLRELASGDGPDEVIARMLAFADARIRRDPNLPIGDTYEAYAGWVRQAFMEMWARRSDRSREAPDSTPDVVARGQSAVARIRVYAAQTRDSTLTNGNGRRPAMGQP